MYSSNPYVTYGSRLHYSYSYSPVTDLYGNPYTGGATVREHDSCAYEYRYRISYSGGYKSSIRITELHFSIFGSDYFLFGDR